MHFIQSLYRPARERSLGDLLVIGALLAGVFAIAELLVGGVVLDEAVEFAQIMTGSVEFPVGHPHRIYYNRAPTVTSYLAVVVWRLLDDPLVLSALRNFIQMFFTFFAPYALTVVLTRNVLWGIAVSAITLTGTSYQEYFGGYILFVFPNYYSNGQISLHLTLLTVALVLGRYYRIGGVLLGALPAIHAAMIVVAWPWALGHLFLLRHRHQAEERRRLISGVCAGLAVSVVFFVAYFTLAPPVEVEPPYDVAPDAGATYLGFTELDWHRQPLDPLSRAFLLSPVALFLVGALLWSNARRLQQHGAGSGADLRQHTASLMMLGLVVWGFIYGVWLFELVAGWLPSAVRISMPNRHTNVSVMLLLPLTLAALCVCFELSDARSRLVGQLLLAGLLVVAGTYFFVHPGRVQTFLLPSVWALLFGIEVHRRFQLRRFRARAVALPALLAVALWVTSEPRLVLFFAAAVSGTLVALAVGRYFKWRSGTDQRRRTTAVNGGVVAGCVILVTASLYIGTDRPIYDPGTKISEFDRRLQAWLGDHARPSEPILAFLNPYSYLPAKTGHPVIADGTTFYTMSYMPTLGPVIGMMAREIYGIDFSRPEQYATLTDAMTRTEVWMRRTRPEWRALADKYGFRLVLSRTDLPIALPSVLSGPLWTLHVVPPEGGL